MTKNAVFGFGLLFLSFSPTGFATEKLSNSQSEYSRCPDIISLKEKQRETIAKISLIEKAISQSEGFNEDVVQLWNFPHYRDWLQRQTQLPWSLFDPSVHGATPEGQIRFMELLKGQDGNTKRLLGTVRNQFIQFQHNVDQYNKIIIQRKADKEELDGLNLTLKDIESCFPKNPKIR